MVYFVTLTVGALVLTLFIVYMRTKRPAYLPPGPPIIPLLGNLNLDPRNLVKSFRQFRKEYGEVFSLIFGTKTVVVINGITTLKDFLIKNGDKTSERPDILVFTDLTTNIGILGSSGPDWKEQRSFVMNAFREFGLRGRQFECIASEELVHLIQCIKEKNGKPFDAYDLLQISVANILCTILISKRYDFKERKILSMLAAIAENAKNSDIIGLATFFPVVKHIPGDLLGIRKCVSNARFVENTFREAMEEHKTTFDDSNIRDLLDAYLKKMSHSENTSFTETSLCRVLSDIFVAGTETTATTVYWFILFCIRNPSVQKKMRKEIGSVVGELRKPSMQDRQRLPYCEAVLLETLRCGNVLPFSLPHGLSSDVEFKGFKITKDAIIFPNLNSVLFDPNVFHNPDEFLPTRFLDEDGKLVHQEKITPFSLGRRVCIGESLARTDLFLLTTSIIQRFELLPDVDGAQPSIEGQFGVVNAPKRFSFRAVEIIKIHLGIT